MMVYPLDSNLPALLTQVAAGYPVMVRFTEGSALWAEPRLCHSRRVQPAETDGAAARRHESEDDDEFQFV
jgi:hypothetical protein